MCRARRAHLAAGGFRLLRRTQWVERQGVGVGFTIRRIA